MSELQSTIADFAMAVKAKFGRTPAKDAPVFDQYDGAPLRREELEELFALDTDLSTDDTSSAELRESERMERLSMAKIRDALYAE